MRIGFESALLALALIAAPAWAETPATSEVQTCARVEAGSVRTLCHEIEAPVSLNEAWALWSTSEGLRAWMAPVAAIELRVGGLWEASYDPAARLGDAGNIHNRVLAFLPERMLAISIDRAPPGFEHADLARTLWTVVEFEPVDAARTRVRVSMTGFGAGAGYDALYSMFDWGNAHTLRTFEAHVARGGAS